MLMLGRNGIRGLGASILALLLSISSAGAVHAQGAATVTGRVTTEAGQALFGANVTIEALAISVGTNEEGRYTISVPGARVRGQQVVLRVRSFGYVPEVKSITLTEGSQTHDFALKQDVSRLSSVVVTGVAVGTEIKKLPFTVAQVTAEDMPVPGANPLTQLQGKVPGANIVSASGRPGSSPAIILRGPQSINASGRGQEPLYIIDGVISQGGLQDINPQDIENVEVVKGAAASSLYGSRAGNGVIQITTRSGKNVGEGVRFRSQLEYGASEMENEYQYPKTHFMAMDPTMQRVCAIESGQQDCARTIDMEAEAYRVNDQGGDFALPPKNLLNDGGISLNPGQTRARALYQINPFPVTYNPIRQYLTRGQTYNGTVDATGRIGRTNFFASGNQLRQEGAVRFMKGYTRNSLRLNVDQTLASNWNFSIRTNYTDINDFNTGGNWFRVTRQPAAVNLLRRDSKGRLFIRSVIQGQGAQNENPAYGSENFQPNNEISRYLGQVTARWQPLTWLDAEANLGYDGRRTFQFAQTERGYRTTVSVPSTNLGSNSRNTSSNGSINTSLDVTARRDWLDNTLSSRLSARYLFEAQRNRFFSGSGSNIAVPGLADPDATIENFSYGGSSSDVRQIGMFVNLDLDYLGRYIVSGLVRRDGASLFGAANRWQTYGRGSVAWRASEESWFGIDQISDLKFRASVGQAGNRPQFSAQYEILNIGAGGALSLAQGGNKNLRPEVSTETEIGMDLEVMSRYSLTVTHSRNVINDQILPVPPAAIAGYSSQWANAGQLTNNTFEVSLGVPILQSRDLNWSARVNYDRTTSKITKLLPPEYFVSAANQQGSTTMFKIEEGGNLGTIYGRKFMLGCGDMPDAFQTRCGPGREYQVNSDGFVVYVGSGNTLGDGITKNLWFTSINPADHPYGLTDQNWGLPILVRDATGVPVLPIGSALPDYRWALSQNFSFRKWTAFVLFDATVGKEVWNEARQWSLGDFMHSTTDQAGATVASAKPIGYYWRTNPAGGSVGIGGLYDVLAPNNLTVEDASFVKLREVSLGYRIGRLAGVGDWNVSFVGRNLLTFSDYTGFDPEVGVGGGALGSGVLNAIDAYGFPNFRTFSIQIGTSF
jgi:TonB-linked SusC/RagA family outer membrane protein